MKLGQGHPDCPAWDGESLESNLKRLAQKKGFWKEPAVEPNRRVWPRDHRSQEERIDAIMRGEMDAARDPGAEG